MQKVADRKSRLLGMIGLCRRAGKLVMGAELVALAMAASKKPSLIVVSCDASANTKKRMTTKAAYYGIPLLPIEVSSEALGAAIGKSGSIAAVAVKDDNFANELIRIGSAGKEPSITTEDRT